MSIACKCRKPKSNDNGIWKSLRKRGREWRLRFFKWFDYVSLCPQDVANVLHLYYILFVWYFGWLQCVVKVSYLYIGLLTQLFYLTYLGFLNILSQTQGVIFNVAFEFGNNRIAQISWLNSAWLVSWLDGSDLDSEARWLGFWLEVDLDLAWSDHDSMARIRTQWLRGSDLEMVLIQDLSLVARWLGSISAHQNIYPTNVFFFFWVCWRQQ